MASALPIKAVQGAGRGRQKSDSKEKVLVSPKRHRGGMRGAASRRKSVVFIIVVETSNNRTRSHASKQVLAIKNGGEVLCVLKDSVRFHNRIPKAKDIQSLTTHRPSHDSFSPNVLYAGHIACVSQYQTYQCFVETASTVRQGAKSANCLPLTLPRPTHLTFNISCNGSVSTDINIQHQMMSLDLSILHDPDHRVKGLSRRVLFQ